jgi:glycosyltransferase involved in cell wall biosynthesis
MQPLVQMIAERAWSKQRASPASRAPGTIRVLLLARYGVLGASSRVRHYSYIPALERRGFSFETHAIIDDESLKRFYSGQPRRWVQIAQAYATRLRISRDLDRFDIIWIEKEAMPSLPWAAEQLFYARNRPITIVDMDDFWLERFGGQSASSNAGFRRRVEVHKYQQLTQRADTVTVANPSLEAALTALGASSLVVVPNCIDVDTYARAASERDRLRAGSAPQPPRIGWIGTPYTANQYLPAVTSALNHLSDDGVASTVLIGAGDAVAPLRATRLPWSLETEPEHVASIDIGIMPLGLSGFDQRKSGWKLYQYMAAGRPVVASRVGFNEDLVQHGVSGYLVASPEEFGARLRELAADPALRARMGQAGQRHIAATYGRDVGAGMIEAVFREALGQRQHGTSRGALTRRSNTHER